jgi:Protein of unknown function (DUF2380)
MEDEARKENLQKCGGCDADLAQKLDAEISIAGTVQKVSNLIDGIPLSGKSEDAFPSGHALHVGA